MKMMTFACIAEAVAALVRMGYMTVEEGLDSRIMTKTVAGRKVGEAIINRNGFLDVRVEILEF